MLFFSKQTSNDNIDEFVISRIHQLLKFKFQVLGLLNRFVKKWRFAKVFFIHPA